MTAVDVYELTTKGGATDFAQVIAACESIGSYCLIGGLAVNCYVEPVYTLDVDLVIIARGLSEAAAHLRNEGFTIVIHENSTNANRPGSDLRVQFTTDMRYQEFVSRAEVRDVLGQPVQVARLEDVTQGKLWAYADPSRRLSKRKKDELDLIRLAEKYPKLKAHYPRGLLEQLAEDETRRSE
ncbi:MAG: hypothetical protein WB992_06300 [Bryobacteraceae bacterium]